MRSRFACAAVVLLALFAGQALASTEVSNDWKYPGPKDNGNLYSATCDLPGKVTSKVNYSPLTVSITGPPVNGVRTTYDATPFVTCNGLEPGKNFALGTTTVTCRAKVAEVPGYTAFNEFDIILKDMTRPVVTIDKPVITANALATGPTVPVDYLGNVAITDNCDDKPVLSCSPASGTAFPVGTTTVKCGGYDNENNQAEEKTFNVVVVDVTPPVLNNLDKVLELEAAGPNGNQVPQLGSYFADDNVDGKVQVVCTPGTEFFFPVNSTTVVNCNATDAAKNTVTGTVTVIVRDTKAPTITIADTEPIEATGKGGESLDLRPKITTEDFNKVDPAPKVTCVPPLDPTPVFPLDTKTTVTCTSTDKYGNAASATTVITVQDTTPPQMPNVITDGKPFLEIPLDDASTGTLPTFPDAIDSVWGPIPLSGDSCVPPAGTKLPITGEIVNVVCKATDGSKNTATKTYPVQVVRPPSVLTLTVPANATLPALGPLGAPFPFTVSATDSLDKPALKIKCTDAAAPTVAVIDTTAAPSASPASATVSNSTFALGTTVIVCTVTNRVGTTDIKAFQVVVSDQTKPVVTGTDWTQEATGPSTPVVWREKTSLAATDDITLPANLIITCTGAPGAPGDASPGFPVGKTPITCTTTDGNNNKADPITVNVIIKDTRAPICNPLNLAATYSVDPASGYTIPREIFADCKDPDGVDPNPKHECTPTLPLENVKPTVPPSPTFIECCATDFSGNKACVNGTTTILDSQPPVLIVPDTITVEATSPDGADVNFTVVGRTTTNVNLPVKVTCTDSPPSFTDTATGADGKGAAFSGFFGPVSSTADRVAINCTASTTNPNNKITVTDSFLIYVLDTTGPTVGQLPDITVKAPAEGGITVDLPTPTVTDQPAASPVDPKPTVSCTFGPGPVTFNYTTDPITISCTGKDKFGNTSPNPMTYKVIITKGAVPDLQCPADISVSLSACQAEANVPYKVTVKEGSAPVCTPASPVKVKPGMPVNVVCTSTNRFGDDKCNFTITAVDTIPPVVYVPCDIVREACTLGGFYITKKDISATARDNRDGNVPATCTWPESAGVKYDAAKNAYLFPVGVTNITCTAKDSSGNVGTNSFKVKISDTRKPLITTNLCIRKYCAATSAGAAIKFAPTAYDVVDGDVAVTVSVGSQTFVAPATKTLPLGKNTITYTAVDKSGNKRVVQIKELWVVDCEAPKITAPKDATYDATSPGGIRIPTLPACTVTDNISPASKMPITYSPAPNTLFGPGTHKVVCSVKDEAGNCASTYYTITVKAAVHHCQEAYQYSAYMASACDVTRHFKKLKEAVEQRKSSLEICACHADVDRQISKPYVASLLRKSPQWSSCQASYNKAKFLSGCGRSSSRRRMLA